MIWQNSHLRFTDALTFMTPTSFSFEADFETKRHKLRTFPGEKKFRRQLCPELDTPAESAVHERWKERYESVPAYFDCLKYSTSNENASRCHLFFLFLSFHRARCSTGTDPADENGVVAAVTHTASPVEWIRRGRLHPLGNNDPRLPVTDPGRNRSYPDALPVPAPQPVPKTVSPGASPDPPRR